MAEQEQTVRLRKASGGCTITYGDTDYFWPSNGSVIAVPYDMAMELLHIPDGGYTVEGDPVIQRNIGASPGSVQSAAAAGLGASAEGAHSEPEHEADEDDEDKKDSGSAKVTEPDPGPVNKVTEPEPPPANAVTARARAGTRTRTSKT